MKTSIAMRCTQEQWGSIKDNFEGLDNLNFGSFTKYYYLVNDYGGTKEIGNSNTNFTDRQIYETFDAKIFLEACGIETFTVTKKQIETAKDLKELFPNLLMSKEEKLIAEAKKRGYKGGGWVKSISNKICFLIKSNDFAYIEKKNYLCIDNILIFQDGKWAQIVTVTPI